MILNKSVIFKNIFTSLFSFVNEHSIVHRSYPNSDVSERVVQDGVLALAVLVSEHVRLHVPDELMSEELRVASQMHDQLCHIAHLK